MYCGAEAPGFVNGILGGVVLPDGGQGHRMSDHDADAQRLAEISRRLEESAGRLRRGRPRPRRGDAARGRVRRARVAGGGRARPAHPAGARRPGCRARRSCSERRARTPERGTAALRRIRTTCARWSRTTSARCASPASPATDGPRRGDALLAAGRRQADPAGAGARDRARARAASPDEVLPTAAAIELVHTYSLIHDDLPAMDDDDLRRGRPTCHIAYGENVAILAGDGLFAEAYRLVLERQEGGAGQVLAALREISDAIGVGGMVGGQYVDVAGEADLDARRPAPHARAQDGQADRRERRGRARCCWERRERRAHRARALRRASSACCSRSSTTSST